MSKPIKELPRLGTRRILRMPVWLDGQPWVLEPGVDYRADTQLHSARINAHNIAKRWGKKLETRVHEGKVYVQAVEDEREDRRKRP